uniref:Uncharacterized protein n=1 Tax=Romanomermis culicivorax TaxID=13658 RepID=A0A915KSQ0_ROMCU
MKKSNGHELNPDNRDLLQHKLLDIINIVSSNKNHRTRNRRRRTGAARLLPHQILHPIGVGRIDVVDVEPINFPSASKRTVPASSASATYAVAGVCCDIICFKYCSALNDSFKPGNKFSYLVGSAKQSAIF